MRILLPFILCAAGLEARTVELKIYPPEIRFHAGSDGQKILVVATDDEGVSREVTTEATLSAGPLVQVERNRLPKIG